MSYLNVLLNKINYLYSNIRKQVEIDNIIIDEVKMDGIRLEHLYISKYTESELTLSFSKGYLFGMTMENTETTITLFALSDYESKLTNKINEYLYKLPEGEHDIHIDQLKVEIDGTLVEILGIDFTVIKKEITKEEAIERAKSKGLIDTIVTQQIKNKTIAFSIDKIELHDEKLAIKIYDLGFNELYVTPDLEVTECKTFKGLFTIVKNFIINKDIAIGIKRFNIGIGDSSIILTRIRAIVK